MQRGRRKQAQVRRRADAGKEDDQALKVELRSDGRFVQIDDQLVARLALDFVDREAEGWIQSVGQGLQVKFAAAQRDGV